MGEIGANTSGVSAVVFSDWLAEIDRIRQGYAER
jgi:hypothetical protein